MEAFSSGHVRNRHYRNSRLGEFLKELELTEGRATGMPTILKELRDNGSPEPKFFTDDDYTLFEVELFVHPAFEAKQPFVPEESVAATLDSIDTVLNQLLDYCGFNLAESTCSAIAAIQAGTKTGELQNIDNQAIETIAALDSAIAENATQTP
ncbi:MAG: hypothetical protein EAY75_17270 [Bacteroidetes bacterium]|nr:MAG: hypothetical protein EAY75_17270 [Bacteroidota bacterium]